MKAQNGWVICLNIPLVGWQMVEEEYQLVTYRLPCLSMCPEKGTTILLLLNDQF